MNRQTSMRLNQDNLSYFRSYFPQYDIPNLSTFLNGLLHVARFGSNPAGGTDIRQILQDIASAKLAVQEDSREWRNNSATEKEYNLVKSLMFNRDSGYSIYGTVNVFRTRSKDKYVGDIGEYYQEEIYRESGVFIALNDVRTFMFAVIGSSEFGDVLKDIEYREFLQKHNLPEPAAEPAAGDAAE